MIWLTVAAFFFPSPPHPPIGALYFCPPEWLITGKYCAGPATVWKMGVLTYWLLFGDYPFKSVGDWQLHYPFNVEVSGGNLYAGALHLHMRKKAVNLNILYIFSIHPSFFIHFILFKNFYNLDFCFNLFLHCSHRLLESDIRLPERGP